MPNPLVDELGLGPAANRARRWVSSKLERLGMGALPRDRRTLDPLTVNYEAWRAMKRTVREWPHYKEAANSLEILVSPEDWEEYWGIDAARKEAAVAAYVRARAAEKGYWISGEPQVLVVCDDTIEPGELEVECQFLDSKDGADTSPVSDTAPHAPVESIESQGFSEAPRVPTDVAPVPEDTARFIRDGEAGKAWLIGEGGFRMEIESGDCIGAVGEDAEPPEDVNVRLDSSGFPYVEARQCGLAIVSGRWTVTNYAAHGTLLRTKDGARMMLGEPQPYPLQEGDVLYLGPERPLRFMLA